MKVRIQLSILLLALGLGAAVRAEPAVPPLTGPVVDEARVLSPEDVQALSSYARSVLAAGEGRGIQPQFLLIRSLEGMAIEDYSMRVAEAWKLGTKKDDRGLLFVAAIDDHKVRIEVGGGLEGEVTDVRASRAIREIIAPAFRQGRFRDGLMGAAVALIGAADTPDATDSAADLPDEPPVSPLASLIILVLAFGVVGLIFWLGSHGGGGRGGGWRGGGWGGGTSGGGWSGGSSSDSWSGGGGGFSGGGASGGW